MNNQTISISWIIAEYKKRHPDGHYFDNDTLKFWGEKICDMRLSKRLHYVEVGNSVYNCYKLTVPAKDPFDDNKPFDHITYFDEQTFSPVKSERKFKS